MLDTHQIEDLYPLTPMQRGILFHSLYDAESALYFQQEGHRLQGPLDGATFRRAWEHVLSRHAVLRTAIIWEGLDEPVQVVLREVRLPFEQLDWRDVPPTEQQARLTAFAQADRERGFNVVEAPLMRLALIRLADQTYHFIWSRHHLLLDGWSVMLIFQEVLRSYAAFSAGQQPRLERPRPYRDYLAWLQQQNTAQAEAFWRAELAGLRAPTPLGVDRPASREDGAIQASEEWSRIAPQTATALNTLARSHRVTLNTLFQGAWALVLSRYSGAEEVVFGATTATRPTAIAGIESIAGLFINTLPVRVGVAPDEPLLPWLRALFTHQSEARHYDYCSLADVQRWSGLPSGTALFESLLVFENFPHDLAAGTLVSGLSAQTAHSFERTNYPLNLVILPDDGLTLRAIYDSDRFERATITRLLGHLEAVLEAMLADPDRRLADIPLLTSQERQQMLARGSAPVAQHAAFLPQVFEAQAARTPDAIALVFEGRQLSYGALNSRANQLAHDLRGRGIGPEMCVGLCVERSPDLVVALLGMLKAGAACVPLDVTSRPTDLLRQLSATRAVAVVTQQALAERLAESGVAIVCLDGDAALDRMPLENLPAGDAHSLAFVLPATDRYALVEHGAFVERIGQLQDTLPLSATDCVLQQAGLDRATALWEICWPLLYGARLAIGLVGAQDDPDYVWQTLADHAVTLAHFNAPALAAFLDAAPNDRAPGALRAVLTSGAALSTVVRERSIQQLGCELYQCYAPAEAMIEVIARYRPGNHGSRDVQPCAYVLDAAMQPLPVGVWGEIAVAGTGLARGYLGDPHATAERFCAHPHTTVAGERMFRTGDRGRWLSDGSLELASPSGRHIWLGDVRVDLDAIEAALLDDPAVEQCAVLPRAISGGSVLVAYIVASGTFAAERLRDHLSPQLPAALRPDAYVPLSRLPLREDGRLDEQALAATELIEPALVQRWEQELRAVAGIEQAAVVAHDAATRPDALHLSDLLPGWSALAADLAAAPAPSHDATTAPDAAPDRPALSFGPPLTMPEDAPRTLSAALIRTATQRPDAGIVHIQSDGSAIMQSYAELLDQARRILAGLTAQGLKPRDRVILQIDRLNEHLPTFWACVLGGITPVTVAVAPSYDERNAVVNKLYNIWSLLRQPAILTTERLIEPLRGLSALLPMPDLRLLPIEELRDHPPAASIYPAEPHEVVFFQLTSGSTGIPKCIQETHHGIIAHIQASQQVSGYTEHDITLNWLPMDHVVPLLMYHIKDVYLGCQQVQARTDMILADPLGWLDLIEQHRVTHTWSPNFGYKLLGDRLAKSSGKRWDLGSIRYFLNAGEQVTLPVVRGFLEQVAPFGVAPQAMQPAYGMAELCTAMTYVSDFDPLTRVGYFDKTSLYGRLRPTAPDDPAAVNFVEVGPPTPGVAIRIVDHANQVLREGVIGRVQVQGEVVTPGYLDNPAANQEAFTDDGWFYTGDLGFILDGRLTITGREKEVIIINGANYYCYEIEDIVNETPGVEATYVAAVAVDDPRSGTEGIAIFFTPALGAADPPVELITTIRARIVAGLGLSPLYVVPVAKDEFPKTTSGKIQRTQLKTGLLDGRFHETLKQIDIALENTNTLPDWFYRKVWQRNEIGRAAQSRSSEPTLVFVDDQGLGAALCVRLRAAGRVCVAVEAGVDFERLHQDRYRIAPGDREHYGMLLESLARDGVRPAHLLHLWTYAPIDTQLSSPTAIEQAQQRGVESLLYVTQALAQRASATPIRLLVVSSGVQPVTPADQLASERASVLGLVKTVGQELPWLVCTHVDLPLDSSATNVARLIREVGYRHKEREVAYRDQRRLVARLERVDLGQESREPLPFKTGGLYLVSGGLGGIGVLLARYLREQHDARLILIGRTSLFESSATNGDQPDHDDQADQRSQAWQQIQSLGEVLYEAVDVADLAALRELVARAEQRWQRPLDGVIHLAGAYHERLLTEETERSFADLLRPKLLGTWTLHQLLAERPDALMIAFSSVNSFFGGFGVGAYAAANSFLEAFAHERRRAGWPQTYCYAWSMWEGVGISREIRMKDLAHARGYASISARQGLMSLLAGLHHTQPALLIGLDRSRPQMRRLLNAGEHRAQELWCYFSSSDPQVTEQLTQLDIRDRLGTRSRCTFTELAALPRTADGQIDRAALPTPSGARVMRESSYVAPQTEFERLIAAIWQDVLRVENVGVHDNFFELGGQSLLMAQVQGKLRSKLNRDISMVDMFRYPTVGALAKHLGTGAPPAAPPSREQDRTQKQRAAVSQQKRLAKRRRDGDE